MKLRKEFIALSLMEAYCSEKATQSAQSLLKPLFLIVSLNLPRQTMKISVKSS